MVDIPLPILTSPGREPQAAGGRVVNAYPEKLPATAGKPHAYWRTPGLAPWATSTGANYRGALLVGNQLYAVIDGSVYVFPPSGGSGTQLSGTVGGTNPVTMARNNQFPPDIVIVSSGDGAFWIASAAPTLVQTYPDSDIGQPNAVVFHKGFFIFTYGNGLTRASDVNSTNINSLNYATAESKPDTLYRPIPLGNGQLLLAGSNSMEVWGGLNDTGYPFSYVSTIGRGILGSHAIAGHDDGFGKGIYLAGDDFKVSTLDGYTVVPISPNELDLLIEQETNKSTITVSVYVSQGHGVVAVQGRHWCWEFDTTLKTWHERASHLVDYWRGKFPVAAFGKWICGDRQSGNLAVIDGRTNTEFADPLLITIETGPMNAFPKPIRINGLELYLTKGVGRALATAADEIDPDISIQISRDGGQTWSNPRNLKIGKQALTDQRVRSAIWGSAHNQGVRWRVRESAPLNFALMGIDMDTEPLR